MATKEDILWGLYQENTAQGRHHEEQRATMTNVIIAICAGVLGLVALDGKPSDLYAVLGFFLVIVGLFGALFSAKHYERFSMHMERARGYRDELEHQVPGARISSIKATADAKSRAAFPRLTSLRLFKFWIALHLAVSGLGVLLVLWTLK